MSELFLAVVNMSISASWLVLVILLLRLLLKKAPRWMFVLLWGVAAIRLVCPITIESVMSLIPSAQTIAPEIMMDKAPEINTGIPIINQVINPVISGSFTPDPITSANPLQIWIPIVSLVWISGILLMFFYVAVSYARLKHRVSSAVILRDNIFWSGSVTSPFVLGLITPRIYLPYGINDRDAEHVIAHERAHIKRCDHLWKPLGFLILTLHWFNPLMWLGYVLLCRDIELACDEKVIGKLNTEQKADYSQALLNCSVNRRMIAACPLAFGEVGVKNRVKSVLSYKKPAFWIIVLTVIACVALAFCFLTNPTSDYDGDLSYHDDINTDYEGVYVSVKSIDINSGGYEVFNLVWHNKTSHSVTYGESYYIRYKDGEEWIDVTDGDISFPAIGLLLRPHSTVHKSYTTQHFDISKAGSYRLVIPFSLDEGDGNKRYYTYVEFEVGSASGGNPGLKVDDTGAILPSIDVSNVPKLNVSFGGVGAEALTGTFTWNFDMGNGIYQTINGDSPHPLDILPRLEQSALRIVRGYEDSSVLHLDFNIVPDSISINCWSLAEGNYKEKVEADVDGLNIKLKKGDTDRLYEVVATFSRSNKYGGTVRYSFCVLGDDGINTDRQLYTVVIDSADFDIDGDGIKEQCYLRYGPTSGLFTFIFSAAENGRLEYFNIFYSPYTDLSFEENKDGKMMLIGKNKDVNCYMGIDVSDGNIVISSDEQDVYYWGEQGLNSPYAHKTENETDALISSVLKEKYRSAEPDGLLWVRTWRELDSVRISGTPLASGGTHALTETFYLLVYCAKYTLSEGEAALVSESFIPTVISFGVDEDGNYTLSEHWSANDGADYEASIRNKFSNTAATEALNTDKYSKSLRSEAQNLANAYFDNLIGK